MVARLWRDTTDMKTKSLETILRPSGVIFDPAKHSYTNEVSGELYTGCTTISGAWDKSSFLGPWHAKEMALKILGVPYDIVHSFNPEQFESFVLNAKGAAREKGDQAKVDGTAAHDAIENVIAAKMNGTKKYVPKKLETKESNNAFKAFVGWAKGKQITWLASEEVIASHEYKVAGKLDAIAVVDGLTYLVDFKTSSQLSADYLLQAAGYDLMLREMGLQVMGYLILRVPKDGADAESLTITDSDEMAFFRDTFLRQREAHKFYVLMDNKFKDSFTHKMKVDVKPIENKLVTTK